MPLLILNEDELRQSITLSATLEAVENAFTATAESRLTIPGHFSLRLSDINGEMDVKGAYLQEAPYYVVKVASSFADNPTLNLPVNSGLIVVFDTATGFPAAIMLDNGYLSHIRAGAAGALAAKYLANPESKQVAIIGAGRQAYAQLKALMTTRTISRVLVWDHSPLNADNYARRMVEDHDLDIQIAGSINEAAQSANLIIVTTSSSQPLLKAEWLKPGTHITVAGSNNPSKQQLELDVLQQADIIVVDNFEQCSTGGEIHHGLQAGVITKADVQGELSSLIVGKIPGRTDPRQITLADLTGLDSQDAVVATLAMEKAIFYGLGQRIEAGLDQSTVNSLSGSIL